MGLRIGQRVALKKARDINPVWYGRVGTITVVYDSTIRVLFDRHPYTDKPSMQEVGFDTVRLLHTTNYGKEEEGDV